MPDGDEQLPNLLPREARPLPPPAGVVLPWRVLHALLRYGLRTEPGRALWEGYISTQLDDAPWLGAVDERNQPAVDFRCGDGEVLPLTPPGARPNGKAPSG